MDQKKTEQLKKVLDQTISAEEIEKKLKEEKAKNALDNLRTQSETPIKREEPKESPLKEEVTIPNVRNEKKDENKSLNITIILISIIALLLLVSAIYIFTKDDTKSKETIVKAENLQEKQVKEKLPVIEKPEKIKPLEKELVKKEEIEKSIKEEPKIEDIKPAVDTEEKQAVKIETKEVIKEVVVTKVVNLQKSNFKEFYNSSKYNTLKCYNFKAGDIFPNAKCKTDLKKFLNKNKNAIRFEVIPVIAQDDNIVFTKMQANIQNMEQSFQNRVKEYMFRGLSRERVLETSWQIKEILGEDVILTPTNYYVTSKKNNKGIIIKAYH